MWLFTKNGFLSIVQHFDDPDTLLIRARLRSDLEDFVDRLNALTGKKHTIIELGTADYRYRTTVEKNAAAQALAETVAEIDYPNFKSAVHGEPARDTAYMRVWSAMRQLQDAE